MRSRLHAAFVAASPVVLALASFGRAQRVIVSLERRVVLSLAMWLACAGVARADMPAAVASADGQSSFKPLALSLDAPPAPAPGNEGGAAAAGANATNDANNPLTPKYTFNLHNYYTPSFYGADGRDADQVLIRGLIPHKLFGVPQLFRFTLPVGYAPTFPRGTDSGLGDLTLIDWVMIKGNGIEYGVGPLFVLPTATSDGMGAGKWQAGMSGVAVVPKDWGIAGGLVTFQQSFAGHSNRDDVTLLTFQPLFIYNLPKGFYLRSTAIWNWDMNNGTYYIPVGAGAGKVWQVGTTTINAFVEPQYTVAHDGFAPQWQIFAGVNFQFAMNRH